MNSKILFLVFVSVLAGLNVGSIRRTEDPVRDTQTNPILYEQKKEEEKDGKKGPLLYHVKNVPREGFLTDLPIEKEKTGPSAPTEPPLTMGNASWWEEEPKESQATSREETVSEPILETSSGVEKAQSGEGAEQLVAEPKTDPPSSSKGEDSWW